MDDATRNNWIRYTHLEKLYGYLPGISDAVPSIFGLTPEDYDGIVEGFDAQARQAAADLLSDQRFAARIDALPFQPGQLVLAVGDSITDDLLSWAHILRHLLRLRRPDDDVRVVNAGLSAHTSAMVLRRWPATLACQNPDWIICLLGGNDVTRVGPDPAKPQLTLTESVANLRELRRIAAARTTASWVWVTPPRVDEARVAASPAFQMGSSTWRDADVLALAAAVRGFDDPVVDLTAVFAGAALDQLQGPDGVHPSLDGQKATVAALVEELTK